MNKPVLIYDIVNDNERPVTQGDIEKMQKAAASAVLVKRILAAIARPVPTTDPQKYVAMLLRMEAAIPEPHGD